MGVTRTSGIGEQSSGVGALLAYWRSLLDHLGPLVGHSPSAKTEPETHSGWSKHDAALNGAAQHADHKSHAQRLLSIERGFERVAVAAMNVVIPKAPTKRMRGRGLLPQSSEVERGAHRVGSAKQRLGETKEALPFRPTGIGSAEQFVVVD